MCTFSCFQPLVFFSSPFTGSSILPCFSTGDTVHYSKISCVNTHCLNYLIILMPKGYEESKSFNDYCHIANFYWRYSGILSRLEKYR